MVVVVHHSQFSSDVSYDYFPYCIGFNITYHPIDSSAPTLCALTYLEVKSLALHWERGNYSSLAYLSFLQHKTPKLYASQIFMILVNLTP